MMNNIKELLQSEICSYESELKTSAKEAYKYHIMQSCYYEFVATLKQILDAVEQEEEE